MMNNSVYSNQLNSSSGFVYFKNAKEDEAGLCSLEMKALLGEDKVNKYFLSKNNLNISRSVYLRSKIEILFSNSSLEELSKDMKLSNLALNNYKIHFIKTDDYVEYQDRLSAIRLIGFSIVGTYSMNNPLVELALTKIDGIWIFGNYIRNEDSWQFRKHKPYNYSHAFGVKLAKSLVNLAIGNDFSLKVIDPCCGIGTVVIEGRVLGANISGYELNPLIAEHCNENLRHLGFLGDVKNQDMLTITESYDVAILDIPYGHFSLTTINEQTALITKTRQIAKKAVIISMEDITPMIEDCGFEIHDMCTIAKSNSFKRYIYICK